MKKYQINIVYLLYYNFNISLGKYIMSRTATIEEQCTTCMHPTYNHNTMLYHNKTYIVI